MTRLDPSDGSGDPRSATSGIPWLHPRAIAKARIEAASRGVSVMEVLQEKSALDATPFIDAVGLTFRLRVARLLDFERWIPAYEVLPFREAIARRCIPFRNQSGRLRLVFCNPFDDALVAWGEERIRQPFIWALAHPADVDAFFTRAEGSRSAVETALEGTEANEGVQAARVDEVTLRSIVEDASPVVKLVSSTLYDAHRAGASDIHLETGPTSLVIKYRLDGVLVKAGTLNGAANAEQVISRIKVMAELDIAERRVPQDGRFKISLRGREVDFRVSIMPSVFGEDAVLRILDKQAVTDSNQKLTLEFLGFDEESKAVIRKLAREPYGMFLVTGPTGSGKTTTLYAALSEVNTGEEKIITIEDPVEYQLPGVLQIPVNDKKGLTFARGLRSILRHDPDTVMVGEIRDPETAQISIQAALTGHLVFTTVHANNVFDVIGRFTHMEVDPYSFVAALNGILAQRLVRAICPTCGRDEAPGAALLQDSRLASSELAGWRFRRGAGCQDCRGTGYKGRKAIAEILVLNDEIRELIVQRAPVRQLKEAARRAGTRLLREAALALVRRGITDLREVNRVTFVD